MTSTTRPRPQPFPVPHRATVAGVALVLALLAGPARPGLDGAGVAAAQGRPGTLKAPGGGPVLATEDTIPVPSALLPVFEVQSTRVSLDEILRRVAEGEARRDSMMQDQSYRVLASLTYLDTQSKKNPAPPRRMWETAVQVYKKRPDLVREVPLRTINHFKDGDDNVQVTAGPTMREELVTFAFEPRARARFNFTILERHILTGHVVYVIGFEPRSKVDALPSGKAWIDTNDFVIVRQEFWYRGISPSPLFLKSIDSCVIERTRIDGRWWVLSRVLARVQITGLARFMAKTMRQELAPTADFAMQISDWKVNSGLDDSIFGRRK